MTMGDKLNIGDFGEFTFTIFKKRKDGDVEGGPHSGHYKVIDTDAKNVWLSDGDTNLIVSRKRIKSFTPKKEPVI